MSVYCVSLASASPGPRLYALTVSIFPQCVSTWLSSLRITSPQFRCTHIAPLPTVGWWQDPRKPPQRSVPPSDLGPRVVAGSVSCPRPRARNIPVSQVDLGPASWNIHRKILINSEFIRAPLVSLGELENLQLNLNLTSPNLNLTSTYPNLA